MGDHPLKGYYLTRVYQEGSDPFSVVSDLPRADALAVCSKFAPWRRAGDGSGGQEAYLDGRIETENWMRESAKAVGVDIRRQNPVYFTLTKESQEHLAPPGMKALSIPADKVDLTCCSFTYGDSFGFHTADTSGIPHHSLYGTVMNSTQAAKAVKKFGIEGDYIKGGRYFEVAVWAHSLEQSPPGADTAPHTRRPKNKL